MPKTKDVVRKTVLTWGEWGESHSSDWRADAGAMGLWTPAGLFVCQLSRYIPLVVPSNDDSFWNAISDTV